MLIILFGIQSLLCFKAAKDGPVAESRKLCLY